MKEKKSKRDLILETAYRLFMEKGFWDTKIIDISDAAGIGKGTVYEYFDSKDTIILELFKTKVADPYKDLSLLIDKEISCETKIKEYIEFEVFNTTKFGSNKNMLVDILIKSDIFHNQVLVDEIHKLIAYKLKIMHSIIKEGIEKGEFLDVDPLLTATCIMGAVNSFISFNYNTIGPSCFINIEKSEVWDLGELYKILFSGLKK
jgi:AcrR family transcriptional regulator